MHVSLVAILYNIMFVLCYVNVNQSRVSFNLCKTGAVDVHIRHQLVLAGVVLV